MNEQKSSPTKRYRLIAEWVAANTLGQLIGVGSIAGISEILGSWHSERGWIMLFFCGGIPGAGMITGTLVGLLQWTVVHRHGWQLHARPWVIRTAIAGAITWPLAIGAAVGGSGVFGPSITLGSLAAGLLIAGTAAGSVVGVAQMTAFPPKTARMGRWLLANTLAGGIGLLGWGGVQTLQTGPADFQPLFWAGLALGGALYGFLTSFALEAIPREATGHLPDRPLSDETSA